MNKIATYLNEHLLGEVSAAKSIKKRFSRDGSILNMIPDVVVFPKSTNDIRKVARFAWQLAEKDKPITITIRGAGSDATGAAIGKGILINTPTYLNKIINILNKDRLVHVQPGISIEELNTTLKWQGLCVPQSMDDNRRTTVGGVLANGSYGVANDSLGQSVDKLEVILANGDLMETGPISKRDVSRKMGTQTFEGEIYRRLEGLFEDNQDVIKRLSEKSVVDNSGYRAIAKIKDKDGSYDLTPLFVGSQGTLGIISEAVLQADFYSADQTALIVTADSRTRAYEAAAQLLSLQPSQMQVIDGEILRMAGKTGAQYNAVGMLEGVGAVLFVSFNDFSDRARLHKLKRARKMLEKLNMGAVDSTDHQIEDFTRVSGVVNTLKLSLDDNSGILPLINGTYIPIDKIAEFDDALDELAKKHHTSIPVQVNILSGIVDAFPAIGIGSVSEKQKIFKLMNDFAAMAKELDGSIAGDGGEGRVKANAAWSVMDEAEVALYEQVKSIFDPFSILNPGVKQKNDMRTVISALRESYDNSDFVS